VIEHPRKPWGDEPGEYTKEGFTAFLKTCGAELLYLTGSSSEKTACILPAFWGWNTLFFPILANWLF